MINLNSKSEGLNNKSSPSFYSESFLMDVLGLDCHNLNCFKEIANEVGYFEWECSDIIIDFFTSCDVNPFDDRFRPIDIVAILNNHILDKARDDILKLKNIDIYDRGIAYYANYFCYCLQCDEDDAKEIIKLIDGMPNEERSKEINRIYNGLLELI
jgi:hypothetical protein